MRCAAVGGFGLAVAGLASGNHGPAAAAAVISGVLALASLRLGQSRKTLRAMGFALERAAEGDLEARVVLIRDGGEMRAIANNLNRTLGPHRRFPREASAIRSPMCATAFAIDASSSAALPAHLLSPPAP